MRPDHDFEVASGQEASGFVKVVVADTSPLNYLVMLECDFLLPLLYSRIVAPPSVIGELSREKSPPVVADWASELPGWLEVLPPQGSPDAKLCLLDDGERDAIQLATEMSGVTVLIDEFNGRQEARSRGLPIIGTLGVLLDGEEAGLVDALDRFHRLTQETTFRISAQLQQNFLALLSARIKKS